MGAKFTKRQDDAFQRAMNRMRNPKHIRGRVYILYGWSDNKERVRRNALKRYEFVHIVKSPEIVRKIDPKTAKYVAYVSRRRRG